MKRTITLIISIWLGLVIGCLAFLPIYQANHQPGDQVQRPWHKSTLLTLCMTSGALIAISLHRHRTTKCTDKP